MSSKTKGKAEASTLASMDSRPESAAPPRLRWLCFETPVLPLLLTMAAYLRCINNDFVFDDKYMIVRNRFIGDWAMVWKSFVRDSWWFRNSRNLREGVYYRPLQDVWLWLNYHLFGFSLQGWHLGLIAVHLAAVWMVFEIAQELTPQRGKPLLAATLFGLMPVHAQAVVWPSAIPLPMSAAFELAAFLCFLRGGRIAGSKRFWALAFFALALLSHESAVAFPLLLVAFVVIVEPRRDLESSTEAIRDVLLRAASGTWAFFAMLAAFLALRVSILGFIVTRHFANPMTFGQTLTTLPSAIETYLMLLVAPWSAGPDHPMEMVSSVLSREFYLPVALVAAVAAAAVLLLRKAPGRRLYLFYTAWIAIGLIPVLNLRAFPPPVMVQDRYLYLSSAAWCLMVSDLVFAIFARWKFGAIAVATGAAALAALYGGFLFHIESFWHDDVTLFTTCLQMYPGSWECHAQLGSALWDRNDLEGAEREYRSTLALNPNYPGVLLNLIMIEEQTGRTAQALDDMRRALVLMPQWRPEPSEYVNLAQHADILGAPDVRESALEAATKLPGGPAAAARARAEMAMRHGDFSAAETLMRATSAQYPGDAEAWGLLAAALARQGKNAEAIDACRKALALKPSQNLSDALQKLLVHLGAA